MPGVTRCYLKRALSNKVLHRVRVDGVVAGNKRMPVNAALITCCLDLARALSATSQHSQVVAFAAQHARIGAFFVGRSSASLSKSMTKGFVCYGTVAPPRNTLSCGVTPLQLPHRAVRTAVPGGGPGARAGAPYLQTSGDWMVVGER
eukprot:COSAG03_NODE_7779_length_874_cov_1.393548_1_plen_147_part_00